MEREKYTVLIVDDDDLFRQFVKYILEKKLNLFVVDFKTPIQAMEYLQGNPPDLLILDMEMPEMDGYSFLYKIRNDPKLENLPVIPCTALASKELFTSVLRLGITDYILKPTTEKLLLEKVSRALSYHYDNDSDSPESN
ncbi:MAG: response regulator [Candidatus Kapaibacteriales bacterium]